MGESDAADSGVSQPPQPKAFVLLWTHDSMGPVVFLRVRHSDEEYPGGLDFTVRARKRPEDPAELLDLVVADMITRLGCPACDAVELVTRVQPYRKDVDPRSGQWHAAVEIDRGNAAFWRLRRLREVRPGYLDNAKPLYAPMPSKAKVCHATSLAALSECEPRMQGELKAAVRELFAKIEADAASTPTTPEGAKPEGSKHYV